MHDAINHRPLLPNPLKPRQILLSVLSANGNATTIVQIQRLNNYLQAFGVMLRPDGWKKPDAAGPDQLQNRPDAAMEALVAEPEEKPLTIVQPALQAAQQHVCAMEWPSGQDVRDLTAGVYKMAVQQVTGMQSAVAMQILYRPSSRKPPPQVALLNLTAIQQYISTVNNLDFDVFRTKTEDPVTKLYQPEFLAAFQLPPQGLLQPEFPPPLLPSDG